LKRKLFDGETTFGFLMAIGFALLSISPLHEKAVYETLNDKIPEIVEVHPLFGEFDILVKIECNDIDSIGDVVVEVHPLFGEFDILVKIECNEIDSIGDVVINKIRSTKGVLDTKTLIGTKSLQGKLSF
jgi:DNA-binding Lrp family transcriptional regulator